MNTAIVVAAGSGKRFGSATPKQFIEVAGKPILVHTLLQFENCPVIDEIVLVIAQNDVEAFSNVAAKYDLAKLKAIVGGGETRAASVYQGMLACNPTTNIVAVHDGARPFVSVIEIEQTIEKAAKFGAACLLAPVTDTIKQVSGDVIAATLDRTALRRALTPQAFEFQMLMNAFSGSDFGIEITDECFIVEKAGHKIHFVEGSPKNIKITFPEDLLIAESFLKRD